MIVGSIKFISTNENLEILAMPVQELLKNWPDASEAAQILAAEIDPEVADTSEFLQKYNLSSRQCANTLVVETKRGGISGLAVCLTPAGQRADINGAVKRFLGAAKISMAPRDLAVQQSGMEFGSITVVGLPADWPILIDKSLTELPFVIVGGGLRKSKLLIPGSLLAKLPNAVILDNLCK